MILQRASSLSCAATPLPQTFATGRFYRTSSCANQMTGNARKTRHCRSSSSTFGTPKNTVHAPYTPRTLSCGHRDGSSPSSSPLARRADEDNLITAESATAARNRRACLSAYRPLGVPLEPDETALRRALIQTNSVQHESAPDPGPWAVTSGLA